MDNSEFEDWYNKADEEMHIPLLDQRGHQYDSHREKQWVRLQKSLRKKKSSRSTWLFAAAATLIIGLFLATTYQLLLKKEVDTHITYTTLPGETNKIRLPDGSTLYLYEESKVSVNANEWSSNRRIQLEEGHIFIDVKPDPQNPFRVDTDSLHIRVLGTSFWVRSYKQDKESEILVRSGKVEVKNNNGYKTILRYGEKLTYRSKDQITVKENQLIQTDEDFILIYKDEKLRRILADLERRYKQKIVVNTEAALADSYTISFDKQLSLDECLEKLNIIGGLNIKKQNH